MACVELTENIEDPCGPNTAGNTYLAIAREEDILTIPAAGTGTSTITTDIVMKPGKRFWEFAFTENGCLHDENVNENDAIIGTITTRFRKDEDKKRTAFYGLIGQKLAVIITDGNGETKLCRRVSFRPSHSTGENAENDVNQYTVTMRYIGSKALFYEGVVPLTPGA